MTGTSFISSAWTDFHLFPISQPTGFNYNAFLCGGLKTKGVFLLAKGQGMDGCEESFLDGELPGYGPCHTNLMSGISRGTEPMECRYIEAHLF